MEFDGLKKLLWFLAILIGLGLYVRSHYDFQDALRFSRRHPHPKLSPAVDYYSGMAYYLREDYPRAVDAFTQLLTDYPTSYYAPRGLLRLGSSHMEMRQYQQAREAFEKYMEEFPNGKDRALVDSKYEFIKFR